MDSVSIGPGCEQLGFEERLKTEMMQQHPCPDCGNPIWGSACYVCGYGCRPAPAPVRGKLQAVVCVALIVVMMIFLVTMVVVENFGWLFLR